MSHKQAGEVKCFNLRGLENHGKNGWQTVGEGWLLACQQIPVILSLT